MDLKVGWSENKSLEAKNLTQRIGSTMFVQLMCYRERIKSNVKLDTFIMIKCIR